MFTVTFRSKLCVLA